MVIKVDVGYFIERYIVVVFKGEVCLFGIWLYKQVKGVLIDFRELFLLFKIIGVNCIV